MIFMNVEVKMGGVYIGRSIGSLRFCGNCCKSCAEGWLTVYGTARGLLEVE